jgi:hypothetical protein
MRVRKKHQRINWDAMKDKYSLNDLMIGVTIPRGTTSVNIREYCLSRSGVPNLDDLLAKGRSRKSMKYLLINLQILPGCCSCAFELKVVGTITKIICN